MTNTPGKSRNTPAFYPQAAISFGLALFAHLAGALARLAGDRVVVSAAGEAVVPTVVGEAMLGACAAALHNVDAHAGIGARAWVLAESDGEQVSVVVRDDGVGFAPGRLDQAAADGRLGVSGSILGRLAEVGGHASVRAAPGGGTVVELQAPVRLGP